MVDLENFKTENYEKPIKAGELVNYSNVLVVNKKSSSTHQVVTFDSVADLVECVSTNDNVHNGGNGTWDDKGSSQADDKYDGLDWTYGKDFPTKKLTAEALRSGNCPTKLIDRIDSSKIKLYDKFPELFDLERRAVKMKRRRSYDEVGDELNIDRYMCGDPAMWERMSKRPQKQSMRIVINAGMNAGNDADKFVSNMILVCSFIDVIEMSGISTELWYAPMCNNVTHETEASSIMCRIKGASEPMDISRILSTGASGLFRHYYFKIFCNLLKGAPKSGLGQSLTQTPKWIKEMFEFDVCLNAGDTDTQMVSVFTDKIKEMF